MSHERGDGSCQRREYETIRWTCRVLYRTRRSCRTTFRQRAVNEGGRSQCHQPVTVDLSWQQRYTRCDEKADKSASPGCRIKVKHCLCDLLWICCTTSCTTKSRNNIKKIYNKFESPQLIHSISTCRDVVQQIDAYNKSITNSQQIKAM